VLVDFGGALLRAGGARCTGAKGWVVDLREEGEALAEAFGSGTDALVGLGAMAGGARGVSSTTGAVNPAVTLGPCAGWLSSSLEEKTVTPKMSARPRVPAAMTQRRVPSRRGCSMVLAVASRVPRVTLVFRPGGRSTVFASPGARFGV